MRLRTIVLAAGVVGGLAQSGDAFAPRKGADAAFVTTGRAPRAHRNAVWLTTSLATHGLDRWRAVWDVDTDVPVRLWGTHLAPGSVANPAAAEAAARAFLAAHVSLLAPGASINDFTLVSNQLDPSGDLRSVGFEQRLAGVRVLDGAIGFAFKNDHLMLVSSTALPNVSITATTGSFKPDAVGIAATGWLATGGLTTRVTAIGERVIVPIIRPRLRAGLDISYHLADTVEVESIYERGKWSVWVGADDGVAFARANRIMHTTGTVLFNTPDQSPSGTRSDKPAPFDIHTVNGIATTSDANGVVTWNTAGAATVTPGLTGTFVTVVNSSGPQATATLTLPASGTVTWNLAGTDTADAQIDSYVYASQAKAFAKATYNPSQALTFINGLLEVDVNVEDGNQCNAFWDGEKLNFYPATADECENTGRMADVVYHEFGHGLHQNSVIAGIGKFDGSLSEGLADGNAINITGDPGLGRGFFFTNTPLRDENPAVKKTWPTDSDEVHDNGEIIGEALWDLRTNLQAKLGTAAGFAQHVKLYYNIMQRASDIPTTTYPEALAADDDDGDLTNGTPNECAIEAAFAAHNIGDPVAAAAAIIAPPTRDNLIVRLAVTPTAGIRCPPPEVTAVSLAWRVRGGTTATIDMTKTDTTWAAEFPSQPDGTVVEYQVTATRADGSMVTLPDNPADPFYQAYIGNVRPLYCDDFENGAANWMSMSTPTGSDDWEAGTPMGGGGDPKVAHGGIGVFGMDLSATGKYVANMVTSATSIDIDLMGHTDARLQFYRWLGVEDGFFDHATVTVNGTELFANFASPTDPTKTGGPEINHVDKEWRFVDLDLAPVSATGKVTVTFGLDSDEGLQLGGWTLDDLCVVVPTSCGNGVVDDGETCDDGNIADGDGCSATCQTEGDGGCCSTGTGPAGPLSLGIVVLGLVFRRRRAARAA